MTEITKRRETIELAKRKSEREKQLSLGGDAVLFAETNERVIVGRQADPPLLLSISMQ